MSAPEIALLASRSVTALRGAEVAGLGVAVPDICVSNDGIAAAIGVEQQWIERRTGIRSRRYAPPELTVTELALDAARAALADADVEAVELDLVLVATVSQERPMPNVAPQVANALGASRAGGFDLGAACAGFLSALATGVAFIESGRANRVMVVAADLMSRQVDPHDRRTAALFGDGAGAVVLGACPAEAAGIDALELGADGSAAELIANDRDSGLIRMDGHETFIQAVARMEQTARSVAARAGLDLLDDVDLFVFHQANGRITRALVERLGVANERVVDCIAELGNTSAASVPLALEHARADGRLVAGSRVLMCAVGAGFIWGGALLEWGRA